MVLSKYSGNSSGRNIKKLSVLIKLALCFPLIAEGQTNVQEVPQTSGGPLAPEKINFNSGFLHGSNIDISRFAEGNVTFPGIYRVTVSVNGKTKNSLKISFVQLNSDANAKPCFNQLQLNQLGIVPDEKRAKQLLLMRPDGAEQCYVLDRWIEGSTSQYNSGDFELNLQVPQLYVRHHSDDYVDPSLWESGQTAGFVDYAANLWQISQGAAKGNSNNTANLGVTAGFNVGEWRLRKRTNFNWSNQSPSSIQNNYTYAQRDITPLRSVMTVGETNSNGELFDSFSMRGVQLQTDDRMLPTEMRSYSPILRGVAETNAKITVTQRGQILYESIVPPGPFAITDVGAIGYGGDLTMTITEADGRIRQQLIPFSAPPMLLREGSSRFSLALGQLKEEQIYDHPDLFQATYHRGLMNYWTMYGGTLIGEHYKAFGLGQAFNTPIGGISFDVINARSVLANNTQRLGNSYQVNYSKYLDPTNTNITLAAYRYSSKGYYSFREMALARNTSLIKERSEADNVYINYRTQNRFTASVNQRIDDNKSLWFSGSLASYWGGKTDSRQYSISFNHSLGRFGYSITGSRSRAGNGNDENIIQLAVNIPIGGNYNQKPLFNSLYSTVSNSNQSGTTFQTNASGYQGDQGELTYGVGANVGNRANDKAVSGNIQYQSSIAQVGLSATANDFNTQFAGSLRGSAVAHKGGVTLGPSINDAPFAIIEAKGAAGARLLNGQGAKVNRFGYAIQPSLYPYRENVIQLDAKGLPDTVDVLDNEKHIFPRQGAAIPVVMNTITGTPMILTLRDSSHSYLPIGTDLMDANGKSQSVVGQGGQAFIRGWDPAQGPLLATVGEEKLKCIAKDAAPVNKAVSEDLSMVQLEVTCLRN
ncbi:fimbria/pilus outer membrane usher protein [Candidatus Pantoea floridensis]|uniref:Outer membrane usher protein n=1 Tax=Candidatus Pantoea floridensis TaxID=1938870 RepID=A0A286BQ99_9GAMM|nr:fimbria/pilus outer membrane usher protein [Pantoea floridensis]PIF22977.1 outer membrane usher protein [Enterobacteriaceae bacterium JKS000233]SOD36326.1 outer membrane usher protein [Pantoea floridensis]